MLAKREHDEIRDKVKKKASCSMVITTVSAIELK